MLSRGLERFCMVTEIRGNEITSNIDRYFLEKAIEAARKRYGDSYNAEKSERSMGRRDTSSEQLGSRSTTPTRTRKYVFAAIATDRKGRKTVTGFNSYAKTHPKQKWYSLRAGESPDRCYTHAELHALSKSHGADAIYIARVDSKGNTGLARPCPSCREAIEDYGIKKVIYT